MEKCYIGFCTPTRTEMDFKQKKKKKTSGQGLAGYVTELLISDNHCPVHKQPECID